MSGELETQGADPAEPRTVTLTGDARRRWDALLAAERDHGEAPDDGGRFDPATVRDLPDAARRFLTTAIPAGAPLTTDVELRMVGRIKLGIWVPFTARQLLRAGMGFVWAAETGPRALRFVGADTLGADGARTQFKLYGRVSVVDAAGPDVDRSAAGRLAAETVAWAPQALTPQAGAVWRPLGDHRATVTLPGPHGPADVDITLDEQGDVVDIALERWNGSSKPPRLEPFGGTTTASIDVDGIRISAAGSVGWGHGTAAHDDGIFFRYRLTHARFLAT